MSEENKYWHILEEFEPIKDARMPKGREEVISPSSRRNFLKVLGLGTASAALIASCKRPVEKAIPYFIKPDEITPGKAAYYASSYFNQNEFGNVLVKVRDNRPIKLEPNPKSVITPNGTSGRVQASVLDVYNINRYQHPLKNGESIQWEAADSEIMERLRQLADSGQPILLFTPTIISPSTKKLISEFVAAYNAEWHQYDAIPMDGYREANRKSFGTDAIPEYHFEKADCIVSVGCDFLGTWLSPVEFSGQYAKRRDLHNGDGNLNKHYQIEAGMSLTGSNADLRIRAERNDYGRILAYLRNKLAAKKGVPATELPAPPQAVAEKLDLAINDLLANEGNSLVICGDNNPDYQVIVNSINQMLGNVGRTIQFERTYNHYRGNEKGIEKLLNSNPGAVVVWDVNPVYNHPESEKIKAAIEKAPLSVALSSLPDETTALCEYILPSPGYLECWDDAEYKDGVVSILQPTLHKLFDSRQAQETVLTWLKDDTNWRDTIKSNWAASYFPKQTEQNDPERFWIEMLKRGEFVTSSNPVSVGYNQNEVEKSLQQISNEKPTEDFTVELFENINIGTGHGPLNPWLQEVPDPVTRIAWDNYASISPAVARQMGIKNGDVIQLGTLTIPAFVQPGQADKTISIALGYGRIKGIPEELITGVNAYPLATVENGFRQFAVSGFDITKTGGFEQMALVQGHQSMEGRPIVRESTLDKWKENPAAGNELHEQIKHHHTTLYQKHEYKGHKWGMAIDLNKCIGCSACVLACNTENNIPVVGKKETARAHEMHWIRIDRYYNGDEENPEVVRQPVMCQHCDNAPCENVCPVAATNHSSEGLNQMAYNRCIGTRYCNNNCPYKVRRFNWMDYTGADAIPNNRYDPANMTVDLSRMRHNPDVTVRAKGVIEKCSFCVQRIQEKKLTAKNEGRQLLDGELQPACQQACPADAIVFGDLNDPNSKVSKMMEDPRNYHLLEELHTLPSVGYLTKIRNKS
ncbi:quinol:cytochrome c oxidoreductase iron-sulfur protein precursor [Mariniphaga anaerophila]|uniref:Quinol:cytochrome c oxidoreductase iron-sulfur protein n=2 Tax=Mariniphaga anaerophila TaxID=1484053 RepID=A0A1M5DC57_9BACT|nr:quinol:cytochrome c oxidoreductase iron-sulfur protein precursor [Mariniphaga anaerophila]